jgi:hypothetical protein
VATRYDRLAANYLAFVQLASIRLWLRVNESASLAVIAALLHKLHQFPDSSQGGSSVAMPFEGSARR